MPAYPNREYVKLQTNINRQLHRKFKTICFLNGLQMNTVLTLLITDWLDNKSRHRNTDEQDTFQ